MPLEVRVTARARARLAATHAGRLARAVLRAEGVRDAAVSLSFVGPRRIRALNRAFLGHDRVTDVLAFQLGGGPAGRRRRGGRAPVVADIYICPRAAAANARAFGATPREELRRLVVHGVLHALGYDHPDGAGRTRGAMWRRQERYLERFARP